MSDQGVDRNEPRSQMRKPEDYPGYPSRQTQEAIRQWGGPEDWHTWRLWEEFIRGETDVKPTSLSDWLPEHEKVERERQRESEERHRQKRARLNQRAEFVMREQIAALKDALGKGYVRSPLVFTHKGYPGPQERAGRAKGMWGAAAWRQHHQAYAKAWDKFMTGETDQPPRPRKLSQLAGSALELEHKGYIGSDPPEGEDLWLEGKDPEQPFDSMENDG